MLTAAILVLTDVPVAHELGQSPSDPGRGAVVLLQGSPGRRLDLITPAQILARTQIICEPGTGDGAWWSTKLGFRPRDCPRSKDLIGLQRW